MKKYLEKYLEPDKLDEGLKKLKKGIPAQYIVGNVDFCGYKINVNSDVLIPRFETELLTIKTSEYINKHFDKKVKILDIGTGSGAIAITLKKKVDCSIDAIDISSKALDVAKKNAHQNNVEINFYQSDLFGKVNDKYDVIISNPPYIAYDEQIDDIVKNNEPAIALYADNNGLEFYEKILSDIKNYINKKSIIAFEIGKNQEDEIVKIVNKYLPLANISIEKDLPGINRYIFIFLNM